VIPSFLPLAETYITDVENAILPFLSSTYITQVSVVNFFFRDVAVCKFHGT